MARRLRPRTIALVSHRPMSALEPRGSAAASATAPIAADGLTWPAWPAKKLEAEQAAGLGAAEVSERIGRTGRDWRTAVALLRGSEAPRDQRMYAAVAGACARAGEWREALALLDEMRAEGVKPNAYNYSAALKACARCGQWEQALQLLEVMESVDGVRPNLVCYTAAMAACDVGEQPDRALQLLDELARKWRLRPDAKAFTAALSACGRAGRADDALTLLARMRGAGLRPDAHALNAAVTACGNAGRCAEALALFRGYEGEHGVRRDVVSYGAAIAACAKAGDAATALEILDSMGTSGGDSNSGGSSDGGGGGDGGGGSGGGGIGNGNGSRGGGVAPNAHCFAAAISACGKAGRWAEALALVGRMDAAAARGVAPGGPNSACMTAALAACGRAGRWSEALGLLESFPARRLRPSVRDFGCALHACADARGRWQPALKLLREAMPRARVAPSELCYRHVLAALAVGGRPAEAAAVFAEATARGFFAPASALARCQNDGRGTRDAPTTPTGLSPLVGHPLARSPSSRSGRSGAHPEDCEDYANDEDNGDDDNDVDANMTAPPRRPVSLAPRKLPSPAATGTTPFDVSYLPPPGAVAVLRARLGALADELRRSEHGKDGRESAVAALPVRVKVGSANRAAVRELLEAVFAPPPAAAGEAAGAGAGAGSRAEGARRGKALSWRPARVTPDNSEDDGGARGHGYFTVGPAAVARWICAQPQRVACVPELEPDSIQAVDDAPHREPLSRHRGGKQEPASSAGGGAGAGGADAAAEAWLAASRERDAPEEGPFAAPEEGFVGGVLDSSVQALSWSSVPDAAREIGLAPNWNAMTNAEKRNWRRDAKQAYKAARVVASASEPPDLVPLPPHWGSMTVTQKRNWKSRYGFLHHLDGQSEPKR